MGRRRESRHRAPIPPGAKMRTATIAAPKAKRAAMPGSTPPPEPAAARNGSESEYSSRTFGSIETKTPPSTAPRIEPSPPMTIIARNSTDRLRPKRLGDDAAVDSASSTPASPAYIEETVNAAAL